MVIVKVQTIIGILRPSGGNNIFHTIAFTIQRQRVTSPVLPNAGRYSTIFIGRWRIDLGFGILIGTNLKGDLVDSD